MNIIIRRTGIMLYSATVLIISPRDFNTIITQRKRRDTADKPKALTYNRNT